MEGPAKVFSFIEIPTIWVDPKIYLPSLNIRMLISIAEFSFIVNQNLLMVYMLTSLFVVSSTTILDFFSFPHFSFVFLIS